MSAPDGGAPAGSVSLARRSPGRAGGLDPRRNGLNLVRLLLAALVLVAHGWDLSGKGPGPAVHGVDLGDWAVYGFFAISGYLIAGSRLNNPLGTYLVHRVARIYPGFLVCLIVTAFAFAPIAYVHQHRTIDGFLTTPITPVHYIVTNLGLQMYRYVVSGTPVGIPYPGAWDGSLWSLYYEFICYLVIGFLFVFGFMRRRPVWLVALLVMTVILHAAYVPLSAYSGGDLYLQMVVELLPFFLSGAVLYMLRDRVRLTWLGAALSVILGAALSVRFPGYGPQLAAPLVAYVTLWLGAVLPCPERIRRNDVSYGVYVYAFPVQQLLAIFGAAALPLAAYDALAFVLTLPLAVASWVFVERPSMRRARASTRRPTDVERPAVSPVESPAAPLETVTPSV